MLEIDKKKTCTHCKLVLKESNFYYDRSRGAYKTKCKDCEKIISAPNLTKHWRKYKLQSKYNITETQYEEMYTRQRGACAICQREVPRLCIDHCHKTGKVRGLLCNACNTGIGSIGDTVEAVQKAVDYLESNS